LKWLIDTPGVHLVPVSALYPAGSSAEAYLDSTWILNRRGSSKHWTTNVLHWYSVSNGLMDSFGIADYHLEDSLLATKDHIPTPNSVKLASEVYNTIKRTENVTEHERRLQELEDVYKEQHLDKV
jgi:hypothetical protein